MQTEEVGVKAEVLVVRGQVVSQAESSHLVTLADLLLTPASFTCWQKGRLNHIVSPLFIQGAQPQRCLLTILTLGGYVTGLRLPLSFELLLSTHPHLSKIPRV